MIKPRIGPAPTGAVIGIGKKHQLHQLVESYSDSNSGFTKS